MNRACRWLGALLLACLIAPPGPAQLPSSAPAAEAWQPHWIAAPWSTERDGAEVDGSRPMPIFRRQFTVAASTGSATLRIAGLGQYEAWLDGQPLAPEGLHQAWTDYRRTVTYDTLQLPPLAPGLHTLTVMLGNGMYNVQHTRGRYTKFTGSFGVPMLAAELRWSREQANAGATGLRTDAQWRVQRGPVLFSSTYGGEDFDARAQPVGWQRTGFDDGAWAAAQEVPGPGGTARPALAPEVGVLEPGLPPIHITDAGNGRTVYDFGRNLAAWPRITLGDAAPGAVLRLTPGELLNPDGTVSQRSSGGPMWWSYTARGVPGESWHPQFTYYGFRYLEAQWWCGATPCPAGTPATGVLRSVVLDRLSSRSGQAGTFSSSSPLLNRIHALITAAMHNNEVSLLTDCPHREKLGWLEQDHLVGAGLMFNNDVDGLFRATARNIADTQNSAGMVPTIAPQYTRFGPKYAVYDDSPEWGSAAILASWLRFRFYGDRAQLAEDYPVMQRYLGYLQSRAVDGIVAYGLGDWYDVGPGAPGFGKNTTLGVTATLMLVEDAASMAQVARLLGHPDDAQRYRSLWAQEADRFNQRFWDPAHGWYDTGSQTANAMPLALGIVPPEHQAQVLAHLIADIHAHADHVTTGEVGMPYLLRALSDASRDDVILRLLERTDPPSYGAQLASGATALTESWDANPANSQDHFMLGAAEQWFYGTLAGIHVNFARPDEPLRIAPHLIAGIDSVHASFESRLGPIQTDWNRAGTTAELHVTVPAATTVELPGELLQTVRGAQPAGARAYRVAAGTWTFRIRLTPAERVPAPDKK